MIRRLPCPACPYRCDVPSGVWSLDDYAKLVPYDAETFAQPPAAFACHATPERFCHGWALAHTSRGHEFDLLALRLYPAEIPPLVVPLFASGREAAEHGVRDINHPGPAAIEAMKRLRRHPHLRGE